MLSIGLLWLDDSPERPFCAKVERAAAYYLTKYGHTPNVCYVHPSCLPQPAPASVPLALRSAADILPHHFLLGVTPRLE